MLSWTPCQGQNEVTRERIIQWAAKRKAADQLLVGKSADLSQAKTVIADLRDANLQCVDVLGSFREENDRLRASLRDAQDEARAAELKASRLKPWARLGKYVTIGGVAAGGFVIYQAVRP